MLNYQLSDKQRLSALNEIFSYAQKNLPKDNSHGEDYEAYLAVFPFCTLDLLKPLRHPPGFLVYAEPHFISPYSRGDIGSGEHDSEFVGLRHYYSGSEDGLREVSLRGISLRGETESGGLCIRILREDDNVTAIDKMIFDKLITHARAIVKSRR